MNTRVGAHLRSLTTTGRRKPDILMAWIGGQTGLSLVSERTSHARTGQRGRQKSVQVGLERTR